MSDQVAYDRDEPSDNPYIRDPPLDFPDIDTLDRDDAKQEVATLRDAVEYHDYRYYVVNDPVISDRAYDTLVGRLETLEDEFDLEDPNSPTQRVGGEPLDELTRVEHVQEMLSLDSSEDATEVRAFADRVTDAVGEQMYSVEPKFDGFSIEIVYEDGDFQRAVTRGDGQVGEDVSANVRTIRSVPLSVDAAPERLVVRGEIYMPISGFHSLNETRIQRGDDPFANPRNAAAGTVRLLDPSIVAERPLDIFFYDIIDTTATVTSQADVFDLLTELGFRVNEHNDIVTDIAAVIEYRDTMRDRRDALEYEIDGVVCKVNSFDARDQLGSTSAHPRWAFAYKFPPNTEETTIRRIVVQVGRTGKLTPVALLDPVDVGGVTVSRASIHNEDEAQALGVGEGARVRIERAGDVIPQIADVLTEANSVFTMPEECPVCGGDVASEGPIHYCTNGTSCPAQLKRALEHYGSRPALDIEGLGEEVAATLVDEGLVTNSVADLYTLSMSDLTALNGWGETSARNLLEELEASKSCTLPNFIYALGIRHVGTERARNLSSAFTLGELRTADATELRAVDDIGPEVAQSITAFFDTEANQTTVDRLLDAGVAPKRPDAGDDLAGVTIVFTGSIEGYTRTELSERLEQHGANVTSSVSSNTDYLVIGDNPGQRKQAQADEHNVDTLSPTEFREHILTKLPNDSTA